MSTRRPKSKSKVPALLKAAHVSKIYGTTKVLNSFSLQLKPGEAIALTGPNGSGKTTALRALIGQIKPTSGTVTYKGVPISKAKQVMSHNVVPLLGAYPYYRDLTVAEHLKVIRAAWPKDQIEDDVDDVLIDFMLPTVAKQFPTELSSGQAQLFALACACYRPSELVVIDEPEQNLDAVRREAVADYLCAMKEGGRSVIFTSHAPDMIELVADQVIELAEAHL